MKSITLVQIIASLLIVNYHTNILEIPFLEKFAKCGFILNTIFISLSGYLLAYSYEKKRLAYKAFMIKRLTRIYPSFVISVLFIATIYSLFSIPFSWESLLMAGSGFSYYLEDQTFGIHLWFVSVILTCYVAFIPTYKMSEKYSYKFLLCLVLFFIGFALVKDSSLVGIYGKINRQPIYRFLYHHIIFTIGIFLSTKKVQFSKERSVVNKAGTVVGLALSGLLYIFSYGKPDIAILTIIFPIACAYYFIGFISILEPFISKHLSILYKLAPITFEIYLIHYCIIEVLNIHYHAKAISYIITFVLSIVLAFMINRVSVYLLSFKKRLE